MNLTEVVDPAAKTFVCSSAAEAQLSQPGILSAADLDAYMCACCKTPCNSCQAVLGLDDFTTATMAASVTSSKMADLTDVSRMNTLFSVTGANKGSFNDVYSNAVKFFYQVCVKSCDDAAFN